MTASVPEETKRTCSSPGYEATIRSANSTSATQGAPYVVPLRLASTIADTTAGCECPRINAPHDPTRSKYVRPSASTRCCPEARWMNSGVPPTALKARTGELTPPGMTRHARSYSSWERGCLVTLLFTMETHDGATRVTYSACRRHRAGPY